MRRQPSRRLERTSAATSVNHDIALHRRINAAYRIEACNSVGCTASDAISLAANLLPAIGYFKASNTEGNDCFGFPGRTECRWIDVGRVSERRRQATLPASTAIRSMIRPRGAGAVYVFTRSAGAWAQQAYIKPSNPKPRISSDYALALSADGSTLAVGAELEDSNAARLNGIQLNNTAPNSGAVYVFVRSAGAWRSRLTSRHRIAGREISSGAQSRSAVTVRRLLLAQIWQRQQRHRRERRPIGQFGVQCGRCVCFHA